MALRGYQAKFAERGVWQFEGSGDYGNYEFHTASFALLVCFSALLKCHNPAVLTGALFNSQHMSLYAPA